MTAIASLIARLEAATTGGTRKLNGDIAAALRITPLRAPDWLVNWDGDFGADETGQVACLHSDGRRGVNWAPPSFTSSIDSALTLVPEGYCFEIRSNPFTRRKSATLYTRGDVLFWVEAPTPALALCIAALKARAAQAEGKL